MNVDDILLVGRVLFIVALYLFLFLLAALLRRELRQSASPSEERGPADLLLVDPAESGLDAGERIPLLALSRVGRSADNDVVLDDTFVSTEHARLVWNGRGWVVEDLKSTNGTRVNGHPVKKTTAVKPGDTIEFGRVKGKLVTL
ncbi:MAG: FHA domain-containing protein [Chloroflexota bacterium]|nr:MAG: ABC transporter ATP-binding protein [Chloroflexota bacterium]